MSAVVLDAGALIALERNDRRVWAALKLATVQNADVFVPTTALAQVWRGKVSQAMLARALEHCILAPFDDVAREVGVLCGRARKADICDAHVALIAARHGDVLYTSDPNDLRPLLAAWSKRAVAIVRC